MMPGNVLSTSSLPSLFLAPRNVLRDPLTDFHQGGIAVNDGSQGLNVQKWTAAISGSNIVLSGDLVAPSIVLTVPGITWVGLAFDQNMRLFLTYLTPAGAFYRWFDTTISGFVVSQLPAGSDRPMCCLDDNRALQTSSSDILLGYVRGQHLFFRMQRDRYSIEYDLQNVGAGVFRQMGMNRTNRMQFQF